MKLRGTPAPIGAVKQFHFLSGIMTSILIKMKKLLLILLIVGCATAPWTPIPSEERQTEIIIENLNNSKDDLYDICLQWMAIHFVDSKDVIEVKNKEKGLIVGRGSMSVISGVMSTGITFTITINIKDNRIRLKLENYSYVGGGAMQEGDRFVLKNVIKDANKLSKSLEVYIKGSDEEDKW